MRRLIIPIDYEFLEGRHFFTAASRLGQGLCVAHSDLKSASEEVGTQLRAILSLNDGVHLSDAGAERRVLDQLQHLAGAEHDAAGETIRIQWACSVLEDPAA